MSTRTHMMRTPSQTIDTIKGCLRYLLVDAEKLELARTAYLIRLAIIDLEETTDGEGAGERDIRRRVQ